MRGIILIGMIVIVACGRQDSKTVHMYEQRDEQSKELELGEESEVILSKDLISGPFKTIGKKGKRPLETDLKYVHLTVKKNQKLNNLNNIKYVNGTREIVITGKHIVLDNNDTQELFIHIQNAKDLSRLVIEAETLEIKTHLNLYQTHVSIRAKSLILTEQGAINTSPLHHVNRAAPFKNGRDGLKGGDIEIYVESITGLKDRTQPFLISNATNGQDAGHGEDGARGTNAVIKKAPNFYLYQFEKCQNDGGGAGDHHKKIMASTCHLKTNNKGSRSGNGKDAKVGGFPGKPGTPGRIKTNFEIDAALTLQNGAIAGNTDIKRIGGAPGKPAKTCERFESTKNRRNKTSNCRIAVKGDDIEPRISSLMMTKSSKAIVTNEKWFSENIISYMLKYAKDLYLNEYILDTKIELSKIKILINTNNKIFPRKRLLLSEINALEYKLYSRLDYFGNQKSWTPNFSFAVNYKSFQKEVKTAMKTLFYTHLLDLDIQNVGNKKASIISFQENLAQEAQETSKELNSHLNKWDSLKVDIAELEVSQEEFETELKILDREISEMARHNTSIPFMKKAVGVFAAASKVIPVGQPTLGLVGMGVETLYAMSESHKPVGELLKKGSTLLKSIEDMDIAKAQGELHEKLRSISPERLAEFTKAPVGESPSDRIERIKSEVLKKKDLVNEMVSFYKPISDSISSQISLYQSQEMDKGTLNKEINRIKNSHKIYNKVVKKLKKLLAQKTKVRNDVVLVSMMFTQGVNRITANYLTISDLYSELSKDVNLNKTQLKQIIARYKRSASERLMYYHYRLAKSYEYKTLMPYNRTFDLEDIFTSMINLSESGGGSLANNDLDKLMSIYREELAEIFSDLMNYYETTGESVTLTKSFYLSPQQLKALNEETSIYMDLTSADSFGENKNNIRVERISIHPSYKSMNGFSDIRISHDNLSVISKDGSNYVFSHDNNQTKHQWLSSTNLRTNETSQGKVATEDLDIINTVFDINYPLSKLYVNPSARGYYLVEKMDVNKAHLESLEVEIEYSFNY
jgi:hypothetical protein